MAAKKDDTQDTVIVVPPTDTPEPEQQQLPAEPPAEPTSWLSDEHKQYAQKYRDADALAAAHRSLEDRLRQEAETRKELEAQNQQWEQYAQQLQTQQQGPQDALAQAAEMLAEARETGDTRRELELQQWVTQQTIAQALSGVQAQQQQALAPMLQAQDETVASQVSATMAARYADWDTRKKDVAELIEQEPWRLPQEALDRGLGATVDALSAAAEALQYREQLKVLNEAGLSLDDLSRAKKLNAQTMSGSSGRPDEPSPLDAEIAEMQAALQGSSWAAQRAAGIRK